VSDQHIVVRGAAQHNLRHVDLAIPRGKLVVVTGVSGSGKSSLCFDVIYAAAQRRFVESLSVRARSLVDQLPKPQVASVSGLPPAIAIAQEAGFPNPRATVGSVTEVSDYLRVLFGSVGVAHCPRCQRAIQPRTASQIAQALVRAAPATEVRLFAPLVRQRLGDPASALAAARRAGMTQVRVDGEDMALDAVPSLDPARPHTIFALAATLAPASLLNGASGPSEHLLQALTSALELGKGVVAIDDGDGSFSLWTEHYACPVCGVSVRKPTPGLFNWNTPSGMCPDCNGLGTHLEVDPELIVQDPRRSILDGAVRWYGEIRTRRPVWEVQLLRALAAHYDVDLEQPWNTLPEAFRDALLYGTGDATFRFVYQSERESGLSGERVTTFEGLAPMIARRYRETNADTMRQQYQSYMRRRPCSACDGTRLRPEARGVTVADQSFAAVDRLPLSDAYAWISRLADDPRLLPPGQHTLVADVLATIRERLRVLCAVGLPYLTLDRPADTLSHGEHQRIRLATQIGGGLVGVLYVLDEPTTGLHPRDVDALLATLRRLRDEGNSVLVVEHDPAIIAAADWLIDIGPGAGVHGGTVVAQGTPKDVAATPGSLTGRYLSGELAVTPPRARRDPPAQWITLSGVRHNNLRHVTARFPLGRLVGVSGVSGSGKSSLVVDTLYPALAARLHNATEPAGAHDTLDGWEQVTRVVIVTQEPIGRSPRSVPATYVDIFDAIRALFAATPVAKERRWTASHFSFNVAGGRCPVCEGLGQQRVEMQFLPDAWVVCPECDGARYTREALAMTYRGQSIADVLAMDVETALSFFADQPAIARPLQVLSDVGLGYLQLGQSAYTLSGGEAQRVRLARELSLPERERVVYIMDEPTTGLHSADVQHVVDMLHRLVDRGHTAIVIEHNLDVLRACDWLIDIGPDGGAAGGMIVAEGPPEALSCNTISLTAAYLQCACGAAACIAD